jgi:hypothetical protein
VADHGRKWKELENRFPGRSDIDLRNHYNRLLRRHTRDATIQLHLAACPATTRSSETHKRRQAAPDSPALEGMHVLDLFWSDHDSEGQSGAEPIDSL